MASTYRPKPRTQVGQWRLSPNRIAWARLSPALVAVMRYTEAEMKIAGNLEPEEDAEAGNTYRLMISVPRAKRPFTINLTALTLEELEAFEKIIQVAIELSRPVVSLRDRKAGEASANGDDSLARNYRAVPQFVIREGALDPDSKSVLDGLAYATEGPPPGGDKSRGLRGDRARLADELQDDSRTEDDGAETDQPEGFHPMG